MTNDKYDRIIPTGLFTEAAFQILSGVIGQWSDGIWEDTPSKDKFWKFCTIKQAPNGEVLICVSRESGEWQRSNYGRAKYTENAFCPMADGAIRELFGKTVRRIVQIEFSDDTGKVKPNCWLRDSTQKLDYLDGLVGQAYGVWAYLTGHTFSKLLEGSTLDVVGKAKSEAETAEAMDKLQKIKNARTAYDEAIKKIEEDYKARQEKLNKWKSDARAKLWSSFKKQAESLNVDLCRI